MTMDETVGVCVGPAERAPHAGGSGPTPRQRMSARRKQETVLRPLRGEDLELVSRELGVTAAELLEAKIEGLEVLRPPIRSGAGSLAPETELHPTRTAASGPQV